jgi:SAM-dependent methyltransferase
MTSFERQWQSRFEKFATRHGSDHLVSGWSVAGLRRRLAVFEGLLDQGLLGTGTRVLELGCGAGTYVRLLAKRGHPGSAQPCCEPPPRRGRGPARAGGMSPAMPPASRSGQVPRPSPASVLQA